MKKTYGKIKFENEKWIITNIEPHVSIKLKSIFTKIPKTQTCPFFFNNSSENCSDLVWFFSRYPFEISKKDLNLLKNGKKTYDDNINYLENLINNKIELKTDLSFKENVEIRNYQLQINEILTVNKILLCGDDLGLGKTYSGIASIMSKDKLPAAIVVQTHLPYQWENKINEISYLKTHIIKSRKPYILPESDVYIFKYSVLSGWVDLINTGIFKTVIFDECQELRAGVNTEKGKAASVLCKNAIYKLGLSATPIYNYGDEIWNIYDILEQGILGERNEFLREWSSGNYEKNKILIKDPKALGSYLREKFLLIRRTKHDVGQYLEPVNKLVYNVEYDENKVKSCIEIAEKLAIKSLTGTFTERGQSARELDLLLRHYTGISKAKYVAEFIKVFLDNNEPVVLVGWHRDVYDTWNKELKEYKPLMYTGTETGKDKQKNVQKFINGESNLLILSLRSGAGLDGLQKRASIVVFGELDWSPQVHEQVIGRLFREGQKERVMAIYLVSNFGSDPLMIDLLGVKSSQSNSILNPEIENAILKTSDNSRLKLLAEKILQK